MSGGLASFVFLGCVDEGRVANSKVTIRTARYKSVEALQNVFPGLPPRSVEKVSTKSSRTRKCAKNMLKSIFGSFQTSLRLFEDFGAQGLETPVYGDADRNSTREVPHMYRASLIERHTLVSMQFICWAALKGINLRGQTPICGFLQVPAFSCDNLQVPNALFSRKRRESAKTCATVSVPLILSPSARPHPVSQSCA